MVLDIYKICFGILKKANKKIGEALIRLKDNLKIHLSDSTKIRDKRWFKLKKTAMQENFLTS